MSSMPLVFSLNLILVTFLCVLKGSGYRTIFKFEALFDRLL